MSRVCWSLRLGRLRIEYGFRRHPHPPYLKKFGVRRADGEDSTSYWVHAFGKPILYWSRW